MTDFPIEFAGAFGDRGSTPIAEARPLPWEEPMYDPRPSRTSDATCNKVCDDALISDLLGDLSIAKASLITQSEAPVPASPSWQELLGLFNLPQTSPTLPPSTVSVKPSDEPEMDFRKRARDSDPDYAWYQKTTGYSDATMHRIRARGEDQWRARVERTRKWVAL